MALKKLCERAEVKKYIRQTRGDDYMEICTCNERDDYMEICTCNARES